MPHPKALHVCEPKGLPITREQGLVWRAAAPDRLFYHQMAADLRRIIRRRLGRVVVVDPDCRPSPERCRMRSPRIRKRS